MDEDMKRGEPDFHDPDDMFSDTRMTFGEHLEDLRTHLLRAAYGFVAGFLIALPLGQPALEFIAAPVSDQLTKFNNRYDEARLRELQGQMKEDDWSQLPPIPVKI